LISLCLAPVLVTLVAVAGGRERLDAGLVVVLGSALVGTVLIVARHGGGAGAVSGADLVAGIGFSVASSVLYAGVTLVSGRLSTTLGAGPSATCLTVVAAATMAIASIWRPLHWPSEATPEAWFLYLGVVTAALALLAFSWGAARISPTALTVATLVEPLTAVLLAAVLLGERLSVAQWVGAGLLLASLWGLGRRVGAST
jgi:DME family drug/metabolite transporter